MKKLISLVMAGLMLLSAFALASCKEEPNPNPKSESSQTEASATTADNDTSVTVASRNVSNKPPKQAATPALGAIGVRYISFL